MNYEQLYVGVNMYSLNSLVPKIHPLLTGQAVLRQEIVDLARRLGMRVLLLHVSKKPSAKVSHRNLQKRGRDRRRLRYKSRKGSPAAASWKKHPGETSPQDLQ